MYNPSGSATWGYINFVSTDGRFSPSDGIGTVVNADVTGVSADAYAYLDIRFDGKLPPDGIDIVVNPDATGDTSDAYTSLLDLRLDGKSLPDLGPDTAKDDSMKDLGAQGEVGLMVSGVEVLPYMNYGTADTTCVNATTSWLDRLTTYLAEDPKCWTDSDCNFVSFSNSCGQQGAAMVVNSLRVYARNRGHGDLRTTLSRRRHAHRQCVLRRKRPVLTISRTGPAGCSIAGTRWMARRKSETMAQPTVAC